MRIRIFCARRETRTLKGLLPTASETATFTNFAIRASFTLHRVDYFGDANIGCLIENEKLFFLVIGVQYVRMFFRFVGCLERCQFLFAVSHLRNQDK